jgi:hypothetical protein
VNRSCITVLFAAALGLAAPLPAGAAPDGAGLTLGLPATTAATELGGGDTVISLDNTTGHDLSRVVLRVRLAGALARRVELASADWCDHTATTATCKVDRITPGHGISIRLGLRAREGAPLGAAGSVSVSAQAAGVPTAAGTFAVTVASPPYADIAATAEQTALYLHTGDTATLGVVYRNSGPASALLRVADPTAAGFDDVDWVDCPEDDGDACVVPLAAGQSRRLGLTMRLTSTQPAEPHVAMTVEGVYDRIITDNLVVYAVCVYDTGRCTRHLPGTHSEVFAPPSPRAARTDPVPAADGPVSENQSVTLMEPGPVPVAAHEEKEPDDLVGEVTGILAYSLPALLIAGAGVALVLRRRAADRS